MTDVWQYDPVAGNNQFRWPENTMEGSQINDAGRADEAAIARWYADDNGTLTTAGTSTAYTVTNNSNRSGYTDDLIITLRFHVDCGDNPTLNMSGFGSQPILKNGGSQLVTGDVRTDQISRLSYRGGNWYLQASLYQGTAGAKDVGTATGDVVQLEDVGGNAGLPAVDGSQLTGISPTTTRKRVVFTASGSFDKTQIGASAANVSVTVRAGGGGGGGASNTGASTNSTGGGGGEGGETIELIDTSALSASTTVTVGTGGGGGVGGAGGSTGGSSSFGAFCSATGGTGGGTNNSQDGTSTGGAGGTGSGGNLNLTGQAGTAAYHRGAVKGGTGGGQGGGRGNGNANGSNGSNGGGGGGAGNQVNQGSQRTGGAGGNGYVIIEWTETVLS